MYEGQNAMEPATWSGLDSLGKSPRHRTKLERLNDAKKGLEVKLAEVNKAIELMEANPKMVEMIDALERVGI